MDAQVSGTEVPKKRGRPRKAREEGEEQESKPRGRKSKGDKQEQVVSLDPVVERVDDLVMLLGHAKTAATEFDEAIKATAEKAGIQSSVLRKFIAAKAGGQFAEKKRDCDQLSFLFDGIGE